MLGRPGSHSPISSNLTPRNEISVLSKMKTNCICQTFAPMKDIMSANTRDKCTMIKTQFIPSSIQDSHSAPCSSFKPTLFLCALLKAVPWTLGVEGAQPGVKADMKLGRVTCKSESEMSEKIRKFCLFPKPSANSPTAVSSQAAAN